ncbi:hypothetical protein [Halopseudomonas bauzanensis]|uniref:Uncharacterized protein n=1 Tax=Halopseudomonas bauzanensis TaxID=653930 RepID=A0A4U0YKW9_9GAMM|nr:hypothetical protein [Halopseudomonas bauzanensis]TKA90364.1 hypothetical protein FA869_14700 [Halopseudomonas bauzanensis]
MNLNANTMATNTGTLTQIHGIDGQWMTNADLVVLARQIHQQSIDNQRLEAEAAHPPRHEFTPGYFEYPKSDDPDVLKAASQPAPDIKPLPFWEPCNPGCDPEFNGQRSKLCVDLCEGARTAIQGIKP